jgi:tRNA pseudouridine55 synthase
MANCENCPKRETTPKARYVAPQRQVPLSGILNVDKPAGMTSHDVVDAVRRVAGQRKVGHAGTLDPMATGVLLVCLGSGTRVAEYLMRGRKRYRANIVLGTTTDTYDAEGEVRSSGGRTDFDRREIEAALAPFVGRIEQVPPAYSAIKRDGQPLYKLAREGREIQVEPRPVEIDEITILDWDSPSLIVEVGCSSGTYIRSLAHDLGQHLGCGAHLAGLVRLQSGNFALEDAVSLARLEEAFEHGQEDRYLLAVDDALIDWPAVILGRDDAQRLVQGQAIRAQSPPLPDRAQDLFRAYGPDGVFLGIVYYHEPSLCWRPKKVFVASPA